MAQECPRHSASCLHRERRGAVQMVPAWRLILVEPSMQSVHRDCSPGEDRPYLAVHFQPRWV